MVPLGKARVKVRVFQPVLSVGSLDAISFTYQGEAAVCESAYRHKVCVVARVVQGVFAGST